MSLYRSVIGIVFNEAGVSIHAVNVHSTCFNVVIIMMVCYHAATRVG